MDTPKRHKTVAQLMFDSRRQNDSRESPDTVTSTMLRTLCMGGPMLQADFMRLYHERCARSNSGKSSFANNFGYLVRWENTKDALWRSVRSRPFACIAHRRRMGMTLWAREHKWVQQRDPNQVWFTLAPHSDNHVSDPPIATTPDALLRAFTDGELTMVEQWCERALTLPQPDPDAQTWHKLVALEFAYRAADVKSLVPRLFTQVAQALRKAGTRFGDWYDNGCDDFDGPYLNAGDARAYEQLRELAADQDMTVLELLDYERIMWGAA